jgi:hypothetical protein
VLRRRRREGDDQPGLVDHSEPESSDDRSDLADRERDPGGPWDIADDYPAAERVDCGSLLIPAREGFDVQINVAEEQGTWAAVVRQDSGMQLQAFAAPRSGELWAEVRQEIAANIAESGGTCQEIYGRFGVELAAQVPISAEAEPTVQQPVRFLGFDGPRWFLRGVISGPAASDKALAASFDEIFGDVVVVRGDYPAPPREQLEIKLPEEARQALEEQMPEAERRALEQQIDADRPDWYLPDPFTRGPEITETR